MINVSASFKWNDKTKIALSQAPEKIMRQIARQTLEFTGSTKVVANSSKLGKTGGDTERSMFEKAVQGDFQTGFYIGNFTDYAMYPYYMEGVNWTNPATQTKWFEFIWEKYGKGIIDNACKVNKL